MYAEIKKCVECDWRKLEVVDNECWCWEKDTKNNTARDHTGAFVEASLLEGLEIFLHWSKNEMLSDDVSIIYRAIDFVSRNTNTLLIFGCNINLTIVMTEGVLNQISLFVLIKA